jgi:hypothetical protein
VKARLRIVLVLDCGAQLQLVDEPAVCPVPAVAVCAVEVGAGPDLKPAATVTAAATTSTADVIIAIPAMKQINY